MCGGEIVAALRFVFSSWGEATRVATAGIGRERPPRPGTLKIIEKI